MSAAAVEKDGGRWLHAVAGGCDLLLDGGRSQHIWTGAAPAAGTAEWRGRVLPAIDLSALLTPTRPKAAEAEAGDRTLVAYGAGRDDPQALVLAVDAVRGLASLAPSSIVGLPALSAAFAVLFDGIAVAPVEGSYPLCVRRDLDPALLERLVAARATRASGGGARPSLPSGEGR